MNNSVTSRESLEHDFALHRAVSCHRHQMASTPKEKKPKTMTSIKAWPVVALARSFLSVDVISRKVNAFATLIVDCVCHVLMCHNIFPIINSVFIHETDARLLMTTIGKSKELPMIDDFHRSSFFPM